MNWALKSTRTYPQATLFSASTPSYNLSRKASVNRFRKVTAMASSQRESKHDDKDTSDQNPNQKLGDVMSHSFGEGYSTRSDEEGFGGIYGGNQSFPESHTEQAADKHIHENHPAYDKTQGSEVKEKEKGRHQTSAKS